LAKLSTRLTPKRVVKATCSQDFTGKGAVTFALFHHSACLESSHEYMAANQLAGRSQARPRGRPGVTWYCLCKGVFGHGLYLAAALMGKGCCGLGCYLDDMACESFAESYGSECVCLYNLALGNLTPRDAAAEADY
jgi:hypothetical protein